MKNTWHFLAKLNILSDGINFIPFSSLADTYPSSGVIVAISTAQSIFVDVSWGAMVRIPAHEWNASTIENCMLITRRCAFNALTTSPLFVQRQCESSDSCLYRCLLFHNANDRLSSSCWPCLKEFNAIQPLIPYGTLSGRVPFFGYQCARAIFFTSQTSIVTYARVGIVCIRTNVGKGRELSRLHIVHQNDCLGKEEN